MKELKAREYKRFEDIKQIRADGTEFWSARELAPALEYTKWENFHKVIKRAMLACENSGRSVDECFPEVRKTSNMPKGGTKPMVDYELTRYACYLIVQNGDPRKEVIALGQTYFAIQTYRQEVADHFNELDEDRRRLVVRGDIKQWNQMLAETATSIHYSVGKEVRSAIEKIGGTMPEDLPTPEKSIQEIEREQMARLKAKAKAGKLMLDE